MAEMLHPRMYDVALLDPGDNASATAAKVFNPSRVVVGVGLTDPEFARRCTWILDPRRSHGVGRMSAIEAALTSELPPVGATVVIGNATTDTLGAVAVWSLRASDMWCGIESRSAMACVQRRIRAAAADHTARDWMLGDPIEPVSGPHVLRAVMPDSQRPLSERVDIVELWIRSGAFPFPGVGDVVERLRVGRRELTALGRHARLSHGGRIAMIRTTLPLAPGACRQLAPVAVVTNPRHRWDGGPPCRRVTILQRGGHVDLAAVCRELDALERGWEASPSDPDTMIESPRGRATELTLPAIRVVVQRHLSD